MRTIHKYTIFNFDATHDRTSLMLPVNAEILTAAVQPNPERIVVWAMVDTEEMKSSREIVLVGTGHEIPRLPLRFIGTCQLADPALVLHVFEVTK
jgi:hypothetical protein